MARLTIAQIRERELEKLAHFKTANPTAEDFKEARKIMNSYYRLCGLCENNLYMANDERKANSRFCKESEAREDRWYKRLDKLFSELYGLRLVYCGYYPSIGHRLEHGGFSEQISTVFYN